MERAQCVQITAMERCGWRNRATVEVAALNGMIFGPEEPVPPWLVASLPSLCDIWLLQPFNRISPTRDTLHIHHCAVRTCEVLRSSNLTYVAR